MLQLVSIETVVQPGYDHFLGMRQIASKGLVHRDLAARNVLLYTNNRVAKISDFGLCSSCDQTFIYQSTLTKKLPIKWLALESLTERIFSEKSDIWSFGVLMYEIFTFGQVPYATMNNDELLVFLQANGRLERPNNITDELYEIMYSCWYKDVEKRPNFAQLREKFDKF